LIENWLLDIGIYFKGVIKGLLIIPYSLFHFIPPPRKCQERVYSSKIFTIWLIIESVKTSNLFF